MRFRAKDMHACGTMDHERNPIEISYRNVNGCVNAFMFTFKYSGGNSRLLVAEMKAFVYAMIYATYMYANKVLNYCSISYIMIYYMYGKTNIPRKNLRIQHQLSYSMVRQVPQKSPVHRNKQQACRTAQYCRQRKGSP